MPPRFAHLPAVSVTVDADRDGPSAAQRAFFRDLEARYDALKPKLAALLNPQLADWDAGPIRAFDEELLLETISIPAIGTGPVEWTLSYAVPAIDHWAIFELTDGEPHAAMIDG